MKGGAGGAGEEAPDLVAHGDEGSAAAGGRAQRKNQTSAVSGGGGDVDRVEGLGVVGGCRVIVLFVLPDAMPLIRAPCIDVRGIIVTAADAGTDGRGDGQESSRTIDQDLVEEADGGGDAVGGVDRRRDRRLSSPGEDRSRARRRRLFPGNEARRDSIQSRS